MPPTDDTTPRPSKGPRREDDPDPVIRADGPFPTEDFGDEASAWTKAFDEAEPDNTTGSGVPPAGNPTP